MANNVELRIEVSDGTRFELFEQVFVEKMHGKMTVITEKILSDAAIKSLESSNPGYKSSGRGIFRQSLQPEVEITEAATIVGRVFATAPHAAIIEGVDEEGNETEYGRRPGAAFPDIGELQLWVERVIHPPEEELRDVTIRVGRRIVARGILPVRPIGRAFRENENWALTEIEEGIDSVLSQL